MINLSLSGLDHATGDELAWLEDRGNEYQRHGRDPGGSTEAEQQEQALIVTDARDVDPPFLGTFGQTREGEQDAHDDDVVEDGSVRRGGVATARVQHRCCQCREPVEEDLRREAADEQRHHFELRVALGAGRVDRVQARHEWRGEHR